MRRSEADVVFVIDEDAGPHVAQGIVDAGGRVCLVTDRMPRGTLDVDWIPRASEWGCAIVTRDAQMRWNPEERQALVRSGLHTFIIRANHATMAQLRELSRQNYHRMVQHVLKSATPFIAHVSTNGLKVVHGSGRAAAIRRG